MVDILLCKWGVPLDQEPPCTAALEDAARLLVRQSQLESFCWVEELQETINQLWILPELSFCFTVAGEWHSSGEFLSL